jgi:predicted DNA-binding protein
VFAFLWVGSAQQAITLMSYNREIFDLTFDRRTKKGLIMDERTITLPADLVERLEILADQRGHTIAEVFAELLESYTPVAGGCDWALEVARGMALADINWIDDPDASVNSGAYYKQHLEEKLKNRQRMDGAGA